MKRFVSVAIAVVLIGVLTGVAFAQMGHGPAGRMGPAMMGGASGCPGMTGTTATAPTQLTEEKAREAAQRYADTYLKGFAVERLLPFTGMHGTGYAVELKGPEGEVRTFHINPWGNVMPFGGPWRRAG
jgi:hypothetical protein